MPLWRWDGAAWSEVEAPGPAPRARSFFAAAHDPVRDVVVVYGGRGRGRRLRRDLGAGRHGLASVCRERTGCPGGGFAGAGPGSGTVVLFSGNGADARARRDPGRRLGVARRGVDPAVRERSGLLRACDYCQRADRPDQAQDADPARLEGHELAVG